MNDTYAQALAHAMEAWGENWFRYCSIVHVQSRVWGGQWVVRAKEPSRFALRRVEGGAR